MFAVQPSGESCGYVTESCVWLRLRQCCSLMGPLCKAYYLQVKHILLHVVDSAEAQQAIVVPHFSVTVQVITRMVSQDTWCHNMQMHDLCLGLYVMSIV